MVNLVNLIPPMVATMHQTLVRVVPYLILMIIILGDEHFGLESISYVIFLVAEIFSRKKYLIHRALHPEKH